MVDKQYKPGADKPPVVDVKPSPGETDLPPKKTRAKRGSAKAKWPQAEIVGTALNSYFSGLSGVITFINPADGQILAEGSEAVVKELVELGRIDKRFRSTLEKLAMPGKYGPLLLAVAPIALGLAINHNLIPQLNLTGGNSD